MTPTPIPLAPLGGWPILLTLIALVTLVVGAVWLHSRTPAAVEFSPLRAVTAGAPARTEGRSILGAVRRVRPFDWTVDSPELA